MLRIHQSSSKNKQQKDKKKEKKTLVAIQQGIKAYLAIIKFTGNTMCL